MKDKEFKDYSANYKDADGDSHKSTVRAHVVTDETVGAVTTRTGTQYANEGDVLVETDRPGVYDVLTADEWASTGYGKRSTARK